MTQENEMPREVFIEHTDQNELKVWIEPPCPEQPYIRRAGWDENPYEFDCDHDASEKPALWHGRSEQNKDALEALDHIAAKLRNSPLPDNNWQNFVETIRAALS